MREKYKTRLVRKKEIKRFVQIIRESFHSEHLIPSIYRGEGIENFILKEIKNPFSPYRYFVVVDNGKGVVGCAELKIISDAKIIFLNQIASDYNHKGEGIGSFMINHIIVYYSKKGFDKIQLDVYQDNIVALNWYTSLGFSRLHEKSLYKVRFSHLNFGKKNIYIQNYPQYELIKKEFGFSFLKVIIDNETVKVGVIANDLIIREEYNDLTRTTVGYLLKKLHFNNIYFIIDNIDNNPELLFMNKIFRMEMNLG